jgi:hypothetical protein
MKLKRILCFLNGTIDDVRIIGASGLSELFTWIDASYATHEDMKGQTGGCMSMGWGMIHCKSGKQKLNVKSSTETEVVGTSEYLPHNLQGVMFLEEQGYTLQRNLLYQDNQSAIKMESNGRRSCTGNSRHVAIRYFFVKDRVDKGELSIEYCPTQLMVADFFTKPLQGRLFHLFRNVIMGYSHIDTIKPKSNVTDIVSMETKERVDHNIISTNTKDQAIRTYAQAVIGAAPTVTTWQHEGDKQKSVKFHGDLNNTEQVSLI